MDFYLSDAGTIIKIFEAALAKTAMNML